MISFTVCIKWLLNVNLNMLKDVFQRQKKYIEKCKLLLFSGIFKAKSTAEWSKQLITLMSNLSCFHNCNPELDFIHLCHGRFCPKTTLNMFWHEKLQNADQEVRLYCTICVRQKSASPKGKIQTAYILQWAFLKRWHSSLIGNYSSPAAKHLVSIFRCLHRLQAPADHCVFSCNLTMWHQQSFQNSQARVVYMIIST